MKKNNVTIDLLFSLKNVQEKSNKKSEIITISGKEQKIIDSYLYDIQFILKIKIAILEKNKKDENNLIYSKILISWD